MVGAKVLTMPPEKITPTSTYFLPPRQRERDPSVFWLSLLTSLLSSSLILASC